MSNPEKPWNPDDGPEPTEAERRDAARLAAALDARAVPVAANDDGSDAELLATALRVRAAVHPDHDLGAMVAQRAVRDALRETPVVRRLARRPLRLVAAAAAVLLVSFGIERSVSAPPPHAGPSLGPAFEAPVEPGAGSTPSMRLYDRRMREYRSALLGGSP